MSIQIEVQNAHIEYLIEFYLERLKSLRAEISAKEQELKDITSTIQKLKKGSNPDKFEEADAAIDVEYSERWPWVKKVEFALKYKNKPLSTKEVVETLTEFEPEFLIDRKKVVASVSSILSSKSGDDKTFKRINHDSGDFEYTLNDPSEKLQLKQVSSEDEDKPPF